MDNIVYHLGLPKFYSVQRNTVAMVGEIEFNILVEFPNMCKVE